MFLKGKINFWKDEDKPIQEKIQNMFKGMKNFEATSVEFELGYWRKANTIHKWFVENVQDGEDDCKEYYVEFEELMELKKLCEEVLNNNKLAKELLPTQGGFFFGGTEYDEFYFSDLKQTLEIIEKIEKLEKVNSYVSYYYTSSW